MRLIDASVLQEEYKKRHDGKRLLLIDVAPTVDAVPVRHGRWKRNKNGTYSCSKCQSWIPNEQKHYANFCLYCGARMDERDSDNG